LAAKKVMFDGRSLPPRSQLYSQLPEETQEIASLQHAAVIAEQKHNELQQATSIVKA
jgi:hypothetical protein